MNCWRGLSGVVCIFQSDEILSMVAGVFLRYWWVALGIVLGIALGEWWRMRRR